MKRDNDVIRKLSGEINDSRSLVSFLYLLMRDYLTVGDVEELIMKLGTGSEYQFTNGWIALYAKNLADDLLSDKKDEGGYD